MLHRNCVFYSLPCDRGLTVWLSGTKLDCRAFLGPDFHLSHFSAMNAFSLSDAAGFEYSAHPLSSSRVEGPASPDAAMPRPHCIQLFPAEVQSPCQLAKILTSFEHSSPCGRKQGGLANSKIKRRHDKGV